MTYMKGSQKPHLFLFDNTVLSFQGILQNYSSYWHMNHPLHRSLHKCNELVSFRHFRPTNTSLYAQYYQMEILLFQDERIHL